VKIRTGRGYAFQTIQWSDWAPTDSLSFKNRGPSMRCIEAEQGIFTSPGACVDGTDEAQGYLLRSDMLLGFVEEEFPEGLSHSGKCCGTNVLVAITINRRCPKEV
jgi:hypothetical protein